MNNVVCHVIEKVAETQGLPWRSSLLRESEGVKRKGFPTFQADVVYSEELHRLSGLYYCCCFAFCKCLWEN